MKILEKLFNKLGYVPKEQQEIFLDKHLKKVKHLEYKIEGLILLREQLQRDLKLITEQHTDVSIKVENLEVDLYANKRLFKEERRKNKSLLQKQGKFKEQVSHLQANVHNLTVMLENRDATIARLSKQLEELDNNQELEKLKALVTLQGKYQMFLELALDYRHGTYRSLLTPIIGENDRSFYLKVTNDSE